MQVPTTLGEIPIEFLFALALAWVVFGLIVILLWELQGMVGWFWDRFFDKQLREIRKEYKL